MNFYASMIAYREISFLLFARFVHQVTCVLFLPTQKLLKACAAVRQFTLNFNELRRLLLSSHLAGLVSRSFMKSCHCSHQKSAFLFVKFVKRISNLSSF